MKKLLYILILLPCLSYGQGIRFSDLPTYIGNPADAWVPVTLGNTNRKVQGRYFGFDRLDSLSVGMGSTYDTLYAWKNGAKSFFKLISGINHKHSAADLTIGSLPAGRFGAMSIPMSALNASGTPSSTTYLRGDGSWATPAGGGGSGTTPSQVNAQIDSALTANAKTIRNARTPGQDTTSRVVGSTMILKTIMVANGPGTIVDRIVTDTGILYIVSLAGSPSLGPKYRGITSTTPTISVADGYWQIINLTPTANATATLPTTDDANGMFLQVANTSSFTIKFNVPVYESPSVSVAAGSVVIPANGGITLTKDSGSGNWIISTYR